MCVRWYDSTLYRDHGLCTLPIHSVLTLSVSSHFDFYTCYNEPAPQIVSLFPKIITNSNFHHVLSMPLELT